MTKNNELAEYIRKLNIMTDEEASQLSSCFKEAKIKKKQFVVQPGFTPKHRNFILKGSMRAYVIGKKEEEHTILLGIETWWLQDTISYIFQQPSSMFVVALEDTTLLQLSFETEKELKANSPKCEVFFRTIAELGHAFQQRRLIANLTLSAGDRYDTFSEKYPELVKRVPQYALASYLGMTTEFLSRIRNNKRKGKS